MHRSLSKGMINLNTVNHHHLANMDLGHLLARSSLTHLKSLQWSPLVPYALWPVVFVIIFNLLRCILFTCCNQFLLYSCICSKLGLALLFLSLVTLQRNMIGPMGKVVTVLVGVVVA